MPRLARQDVETQLFHIVVQGIDKEYIFNESRFKKKYLEILKKYSNENNIYIIAYCIMDNHTHFLMYTESIKNMSRFMHCANTSYGAYYNGINNRVGIVFRNRFLSEPILSEKQLYTCINYIHNNPVKARMVKSAGEYEYSSFSEYIPSKLEAIIKSDKVDFSGYADEDYKFIEYINKNVDVKEEIEKYCRERNIDHIPSNKKILIDMIRYLIDMKIIQKDIAKQLNVSRTTIGKWLKKSVKECP